MCVPWVLCISAEPQAAEGFLGVMEVNDFALVLSSPWDISMGFSLGINASLPWGFVSGGLYFLRDFSQPSVPVPCWRTCFAAVGDGKELPALHSKDVRVYIFNVCVFIFLMCVYV